MLLNADQQSSKKKTKSNYDLVFLFLFHNNIFYCISHSTNTLGKGMNPIILPPVMGK